MEPKMRKMGSFGKYLIFYCENMRQKYRKLVKMCHQSTAHDWSLFRESWGSCLAHWDRSSSPGATLRSARWWSSSLSLSLSLYHYHYNHYDCRWWTWWRWWTAWSTSSSTAPCPGSSAPPSGQYIIDNIYGLPTNIEENAIIFARLLH